MDLEVIVNGIVIFTLALLFAGIGIEWYHHRKRQHIKRVMDLAKEE